MEALRRLTTGMIPLLLDNVDTDQIIPARFLKGTTKEGLGEKLFADWRHEADAQPRPVFVPGAGAAKSRILLSGRNFGCGSSREHAVWALRDFGFRAVIALSFSDIFRANALKNGLVPVALDPVSHGRLASAPGSDVTLDIEKQTVGLPDGTSARFWIEPFARHCLLEGLDELDFLLSREPAIADFERNRSLDPGNTEADS